MKFFVDVDMSIAHPYVIRHCENGRAWCSMNNPYEAASICGLLNSDKAKTKAQYAYLLYVCGYIKDREFMETKNLKKFVKSWFIERYDYAMMMVETKREEKNETTKHRL